MCRRARRCATPSCTADQREHVTAQSCTVGTPETRSDRVRHGRPLRRLLRAQLRWGPSSTSCPCSRRAGMCMLDQAAFVPLESTRHLFPSCHLHSDRQGTPSDMTYEILEYAPPNRVRHRGGALHLLCCIMCCVLPSLLLTPPSPSIPTWFLSSYLLRCSSRARTTRSTPAMKSPSRRSRTSPA